MSLSPVKTPCVGVCSTGIGDTVCRGCKRFSHEVIAWNSYSEDERAAVLARLDTLLAQIVSRWVLIENVDLLRTQMLRQQLVFNAARHPASWVFELLKAGASQIDDLSVFGLCLQNKRNKQALQGLRVIIEKEFYALSLAHFERYFL